MKRFAAVVVFAGLSLACLNGGNRHAFYLEPDGAATWSVTEEDVRPETDGPEAESGAADEYLARVLSGDHAVARALRALGASRVETTVVRDRSPYTVVTEARFDSSARMIEEFLIRVGFEATAELSFEADSTRLTFSFRELEVDAGDGEGEVVEMHLLEPVEAYRFVLTDGEFVEATGFRLEKERTVATMIDPEEVEPGATENGVSYSLAWTTGRRPGG